ncbi:hypothetical protein MVEN_01317100 [Mycena venus]|uniref:DUF6533 domain-containing protein n=1 Tax=Mycena venus TaxID=2733690 RepID=A0A8H6XZX2_9AGAR|nr:hypothetical protein MVEN_01317100 [Mycena venus]
MSTIDIQIQLEINANYYLNLVAFSLLFYEFFLTFNLEVSRYWGLAPTAPNVLFFLNRYGMLFGTVPIVFQYFWTTTNTPQKLASTHTAWRNRDLTCTRCETLHTYHEWFAVVSQIIIGVMLILRTYALYERNRRVLGLMVFVSAGVIAVGAWSVISGPSPKPGDDVPQLDLYIGCSTGMSSSQSTGLAAAWAGMGVFDCTIFMLTLYRALSRRHAPGLDLVTVLLRDGSIYFAIIVVVNLSNILTFVLAGSYSRGVPTTLANVISSIMISRLMFNLRDPSLSTMSGRFSASATLTNGPMFSTHLDRSGMDGLATTHDYDLNANANDIELEDRLYR